MDSEIQILKDSIYQSWTNLISHLPTIFLSVFVFIIGLLVIKIINKYAKRIIVAKANDPLIADFVLNIISGVITILLFVICLGILGFDDVTNKILAGAGLTTFIIGFALKDIGENFIAGILMAFQRPFKIGDLIEIDGIKGRVIEMRLRSTTLKTIDGIDAYIPNGSILRNNLKNYTVDEFMRENLILKIDYDDYLETKLKKIQSVLNDNKHVLKSPAPLVVLDTIDNKAIIFVHYWFKTDKIKLAGIQLKSDLQLQIHAALKSNA